MLSSLSNKKKLKLLAIGLLPLLFICYQLSFSKTLSQYNQYHRNCEYEAAKSNPTVSSSQLKSKSQQLDVLMKSFSLDTIDNAKNLLRLVTQFCDENGLRLREYKPLGTAMYDSTKVLTRAVSVEGPFLNCLQLVYSLEKRQKLGRISSVTYTSNTLPKNKAIRLNCTFYVQNIVE